MKILLKIKNVFECLNKKEKKELISPLKKYTISIVFPNENMYEDAMKKI